MKIGDLIFVTKTLADELRLDRRVSYVGEDSIWEIPGFVFRIHNPSIIPLVEAYEAPFRQTLISTKKSRWVLVYLSEGAVR